MKYPDIVTVAVYAPKQGSNVCFYPAEVSKAVRLWFVDEVTSHPDHHYLALACPIQP